MELLGKVVDGLISIMEGEGTDKGVGGTVRGRCLVDVLAGCGELAFVEGGEKADEWKGRWKMLVERFVELFIILLAEYMLPLPFPYIAALNSCFQYINNRIPYFAITDP